ncbi:GNAT family N-acetyltransferase [Ornithinimicrobium sp. LYQ103]|uniref:GNAT family N-acetyltransferase n=1 Tax=Ornithinimicrobium sp. LYQ103 TaxID=3378796 RepID=UPI0038535AA1
MPADQPTDPRPLPDGLVLRTATPADLDQIGELLTARGDAHDAEDHRLVVEDPAAGWETCAVVVDGDRVVSTATLLDEELGLSTDGLPGPVRLPAGQVELVATDPGFEGRGLVRELMGWAHDLSAARGHLLQVMIGIPYFYRLFGYSYAVDIPAHRPLVEPPGEEALAGHAVRPATTADLPDVRRLQEHAQQAADLRMPHSPPRWQWLLDRHGSTTWVVERTGPGGTAEVVATGRTTPPEDDVVLAELAATDRPAALAMVARAHRLATSVVDASPLVVWDRRGTVAGEVVDELCGPAPRQAEQYYVRVPDEVVLLDRLRPVLDARLAAADLGPPDEVVLSTFRRHVRMPVVDGRLGAPRPGGTLQSPGASGGAGVAPDQLGPLLFGPHGIVGLSQRHPDVYPGPHEALMAALFPPVTADLLTYYLP